MICGICKRREGDPILFTDGCQCYICRPIRCKPCREFWGDSSLADGVERPVHRKPRRREAVLATRAKELYRG